MREPKYLRIKNDLKQQIISGKFENGDRFYTEAELIKRYDVSSITVIRSLNDLVKEGYLVRKQGKGTFISRARKGKLVEFSDIECFPINSETTTVLAVEKGNNPYYLEKLNLSKHDCYYKISRLRHAGDRPFIYHESYIPEQYVLHPNKAITQFSSIYQRFKVDFDIHMGDEWYQETNEIRLDSPHHVKEHLQLQPDEPVVYQIKTTWQQESKQVLEYIETYKHWQFYKFELTANRP